VKPVQKRVGSWTFIPPSDRKLPAAEQTVFVLKPLTQLQRMEVWDNLRWVNPDNTMQPRAFVQARELCLSNIEDVQNFPPGSPKPWPKDGSFEAKAEYLEQFDDMDVLIIGNEIRDHSALDDDIKNSSPPAPTST
jgi:hypothetical protein